MNIASIILTALLVIAAFLAAFFGWKNLLVIRRQLKLNTFLELLRELAEERIRNNREWVFKHLSTNNQIADLKDSILQNEPTLKIHKDAIEETISCLDRLGFFLLKGDPDLKDEAPDWIWTITSQMWVRTKWYVEYRGETSKHYGEYFKRLAEEAEKRGYIETLKVA